MHLKALAVAGLVSETCWAQGLGVQRHRRQDVGYNNTLAYGLSSGVSAEYVAVTEETSDAAVTPPADTTDQIDWTTPDETLIDAITPVVQETVYETASGGEYNAALPQSMGDSPPPNEGVTDIATSIVESISHVTGSSNGGQTALPQPYAPPNTTSAAQSSPSDEGEPLITTSIVESTVYAAASSDEGDAVSPQPYTPLDTASAAHSPLSAEGDSDIAVPIVENIAYATRNSDGSNATLSQPSALPNTTSTAHSPPLDEGEASIATSIVESTLNVTRSSDGGDAVPLQPYAQPNTTSAALTVAPIPYASEIPSSEGGEEDSVNTAYSTIVATGSVIGTQTIFASESASPVQDAPHFPGTAPTRPVESASAQVNKSTPYEVSSASSQPLNVAPLPVRPATDSESRTGSVGEDKIDIPTIYESSAVYATVMANNGSTILPASLNSVPRASNDDTGVFPSPGGASGAGTAGLTGQAPGNGGTAPLTVVERTTVTLGVSPSGTGQDGSVKPTFASGQVPPFGYGQLSGYAAPTGNLPLNPVASPLGYFPTGTHLGGTAVTATTVTSGVPVPSIQSPECNGIPTVNIMNATLEWWWPQTYDYAISTYSMQYNPNHTQTGWTLASATAPFNATSALELPSCTYWNMPTVFGNTTYTWETYDCKATPTPTAAATKLITQNALASPNATTGNGTLPSLQTTRPPEPFVRIPNGGNASFPSGVPFVYFNQYQIMEANPTNHSNGSIVCPFTTSQYTLPTAVSFEYEGEDPNGQVMIGENVIGDINPAFLQGLRIQNAVAGNWAAEPTVAVVVKKVYHALGLLAIGRLGADMPTLEGPSPTLPPFVTQAQPTSTGIGTRPFGVLTARVEVSQTALDIPWFNYPETSTAPTPEQRPQDSGGMGANTAMPQENDDGDRGGGGANGLTTRTFVARVETTLRTLLIPVNPSATVVTASFQGDRITATVLDALPQNTALPTKDHYSDHGRDEAEATQNEGEQEQRANDGVNVSGLIAAIQSVAQSNPSEPTNALDVLTAARGENQDPTASAIWAGIGGAPGAEDGGNEGVGQSQGGNDDGRASENANAGSGQSEGGSSDSNNGASGSSSSNAGAGSSDSSPSDYGDESGNADSGSSGSNSGTGSTGNDDGSGSSDPASGSGLNNGGSSSGNADESVSNASSSGSGSNNGDNSSGIGNESGYYGPDDSAGSNNEGDSSSNGDGSGSSDSGAGSNNGGNASGNGGTESDNVDGSGSSDSGSGSGSDDGGTAPGNSGESDASNSSSGSGSGSNDGGGSSGDAGESASSDSGSGAGSNDGGSPTGNNGESDSSNSGYGSGSNNGGSDLGADTGSEKISGGNFDAGNDGSSSSGSGANDGGSGSLNGSDGSESNDGSGPGSEPDTGYNYGGGPLVFPVGDETVTATQGSEVVVGSQTAQPGGPAMTEDGHVVVVGYDAITVDGVRRQYEGGPTPAPVLDVGDSMVTAGRGPEFVVDEQTAIAGGAPITVDGTVISVPATPTAVVVDGITRAYAGPGAGVSAIEVDGITITATGAPAFVLPGGQILWEGGSPITHDGTVMSLAPGGTAFVIDGSTSIVDAQATNGAAINTAAAEIPFITIGLETYTANAATAYYLGQDATLIPGGTAVVSGTTVSLGSDAELIVVDGQTSTLSSPMITPGPALIFGDNAYAANANGAFNVDGYILTLGGEITVSGTTISLDSDGQQVVVDGQTSTLSSPMVTVGAVLNIGDEAYTANAEGAYNIEGEVLTRGGEITVSDTTISLALEGQEVVVNDQTSTLAPPTITAGAVLNVEDNLYTANVEGAYNIEGQVLTPGGEITVSGTTFSLGSAGQQVVVNDQTSTLSPPTITAGAAFVVGDEMYTVNAEGAYNIDGQVLTPGGEITVSGTTISLGSVGQQVVINDQTSTLAPTITAGPSFVVGDNAYTANAEGAYNVDGQVLTPGGEITVSGTTISLGSAGQQVVINDQTSTLAPAITAGASFVVGNGVYAANAEGLYDIDGQVLTAGGEITVSGTTISLASDASTVIIDGQTQVISASDAAQATITAAPILTINGQAYGANEGTTYVISGETLTPGGAVTVTNDDGVIETFSLASEANELYDITSGTTQTSLLRPSSTEAYYRPTAAPILTIGGETFTALPGTGTSYLVDGQTLSPNGSEETVIIDGRTFIVSLSGQATVLVIEALGAGGDVTSTIYQTLFPATITGGTRYVTSTATGRATPSELASSTATVTFAVPEPEMQGQASGGFAVGVTGALMGVGSLLLAVWL